MTTELQALLKSQLRDVDARRAAVEAEVAAARRRLDAAGVGMDAPLVDAGGFPRADVDVAGARADRAAVLRLSNDHRELTAQAEGLLHRLHAAVHGGALAAPPPTPAQGGGGGSAAAAPRVEVHAAVAVPARDPPPREAPQAFALVDELAPGGPAASAGLRLGDRIVSLGGVTAAAGADALHAAARELAAADGRTVRVVLLRPGQLASVELTLRPARWEGRGLLGCRLVPLLQAPPLAPRGPRA